jgi:hypothetical protein
MDTITEPGWLQLIVLTPGCPLAKAETLRELFRLRKNRSLRIVDAVMIEKIASGQLRAVRSDDLPHDEAVPQGSVVEKLLGQSDDDVTAPIKAGDTGILLLIEHVWATPILKSVLAKSCEAHAGGFIPQSAEQAPARGMARGM